jgi:hypothetical protein
LSKQMSERPLSLRRLFFELFWPFETLSWRPSQVSDGGTELNFSVRLRPHSRQLALRWLILSGGFLVAAGIASTVLVALGGISAAIGATLFFVDRRTRKTITEAEAPPPRLIRRTRTRSLGVVSDESAAVDDSTIRVSSR